MHGGASYSYSATTSIYGDSISFPGPELLVREIRLIPLPWGPGNLNSVAHTVEDLRGRANRWARMGRIWRWEPEPSKQMMSITDRNHLWVRRKWVSFWGVAQSIRDLTAGRTKWRIALTGGFPN